MSRTLSRFLVFAFCIALCPAAQAGFLVGTQTQGGPAGNDKEEFVEDVMEVYNAANDPDLTLDFMELYKTDVDAGSVFNPTNNNNGFSFFADLGMNTPITSSGALHSLDTAYFTYSGPENILFYSVKASNTFTVYTFMAGKNLLELEGAGHAISHVTFWKGPPGIDPFGDPIPEPTALFLGLGAIALVALRKRD